MDQEVTLNFYTVKLLQNIPCELLVMKDNGH